MGVKNDFSEKEETMADPRLQAVYDGASFLLITKGFANTQVSHIAETANIATGTIYKLFTSKKAILHFVILATFDKQFFNKEIRLPLEEVENEVIIEHLSSIIRELFLKIAGEPSFSELLSTVFDCAASYQVAFNLINDNKMALPEIETEYRVAVNRLYASIGEHLARYIEQGEVREVELPELHIRNIMEGITWWAMYLPYQEPTMELSVHRAKKIALDILTHAYLCNPDQAH